MEDFNVDNDRLRRIHAIYLRLQDESNNPIPEKEREQLINELGKLLDADTKRYVSDNEYSAKIEVAEIEAKSKKELAEIEANNKLEIAKVEASSRKESILRPILAYGLPAAITAGCTLYTAKYKIDRYEIQHKKDQEWEMRGTLTGTNKETEKKYNPYNQK